MKLALTFSVCFLFFAKIQNFSKQIIPILILMWKASFQETLFGRYFKRYNRYCVRKIAWELEDNQTIFKFNNFFCEIYSFQLLKAR